MGNASITPNNNNNNNNIISPPSSPRGNPLPNSPRLPSFLFPGPKPKPLQPNGMPIPPQYSREDLGFFLKWLGFDGDQIEKHMDRLSAQTKVAVLMFACKKEGPQPLGSISEPFTLSNEKLLKWTEQLVWLSEKMNAAYSEKSAEARNAMLYRFAKVTYLAELSFNKGKPFRIQGAEHQKLIDRLDSLEAQLIISIKDPTIAENFNLTNKNRLTTIHQAIAARNTEIRQHLANKADRENRKKQKAQAYNNLMPAQDEEAFDFKDVLLDENLPFPLDTEQEKEFAQLVSVLRSAHAEDTLLPDDVDAWATQLLSKWTPPTPLEPDRQDTVPPDMAVWANREWLLEALTYHELVAPVLLINMIRLYYRAKEKLLGEWQAKPLLLAACKIATMGHDSTGGDAGRFLMPLVLEVKQANPDLSSPTHVSQVLHAIAEALSTIDASSAEGIYQNILAPLSQALDPLRQHAIGEWLGSSGALAAILGQELRFDPKQKEFGTNEFLAACKSLNLTGQRRQSLINQCTSAFLERDGYSIVSRQKRYNTFITFKKKSDANPIRARIFKTATNLTTHLSEVKSCITSQSNNNNNGLTTQQVDQLIHRYYAIATDFCLNFEAIFDCKDLPLFILDSLLLNPLADPQIGLISLTGQLWLQMVRIPVIEHGIVEMLFAHCIDRLGPLNVNGPADIALLLGNNQAQRLISIAIAIDQTHPTEATYAFKQILPVELVLLHEILLSKAKIRPRALASKTKTLLKGVELLPANNDQALSARMQVIQSELRAVEDVVYANLPLLRAARLQETWPTYDAA